MALILVIERKTIVKQDSETIIITDALNNAYVNMDGGVILMVIVSKVVTSAQYRHHVKRKILLILIALVIVNLTVMDGLAMIIGVNKAVHVLRALSGNKTSFISDDATCSFNIS